MGFLRVTVLTSLLAAGLVVDPRLGVAQHRAAVGAAEVNGTFTRAGGSTFRVLALGGGKLRVAFNGIYAYTMRDGTPMANTGEAEGIARIQADSAVFHPPGFTKGCRITLLFVRPGQLVVRETGGNCGFGSNVSTTGTYRKTSSRKPGFEPK